MKKCIYIFLLVTQTVLAKETPKYPAASIPAELIKGVNVVYRVNDMTFQIHSKSRATLTVHKVITILNANGKHEAQEVVGYDKLTKINFLKGASYNAEGDLIRKLKNSEIYDQSAYDGFSLYSDNRLKAANLSNGSYPYTVEFEYELEYKFLFQIPSYRLANQEKVSQESGQYELIFPIELKPRYNTIGVNLSPIVSNPSSGIESLTWKFENLRPNKKEPMSPGWLTQSSRIEVAPTQFSFEGYEGSMETWNQFGQWIQSLSLNRKNLPEAARKRIKEITDNLSSDEEKIRAVYEYMQSKTRYVSIQLGIGGFQPFEAAVVDQTGYGDCKALSNYMVSLLDAAGLRANYVLIMAGDNPAPLNVSFSSSQFNHAVVCVPLAKDTVWLECTSQTNPYGYMGRFTGNRKALAITDSGAAVVQTPVYDEHTNIQSRVADVTMDENGNALASIKTIYSGLQYENGNLNFVLKDQFDKQKEWIQDNTDIPNFDIKSFTMKNIKEKIPSAIVSTDLILNRNASVSGKRLFLTPNLMNRSTFIPEKVEKRETNVFREMAYSDYDTIRYKIPESLYPEFTPEPIHLESTYGTYDASFKFDVNGLQYVRKLVMKRGEFPPETYNELIDFFKSVNKADQIKIVFLNKT